MTYKAIISFSGYDLSMRSGEIREISDLSLVNDLLKAGYIIPVEAEKTAEIKEKPLDKAKEEAKDKEEVKPKKGRKGASK